MGKLLQALRRLTRTDWAYIHFKAALGLLWIIPLTQVAYLERATSAGFIIAWAIITTAGFLFSVVGIVMSAQEHETRRRGFRVEMTGIILLMAGPAVYGLIQIGLIITTGRDRLIAVAFAYIICAALIPRMVMVKEAAKSRTVVFRYVEGAKDD